MATGALLLVFTASADSSDFWADALQRWWQSVRAQLGHVQRLVLYLDNGPNNSGARLQWLRRLIAFADSSGLELRLIYYPPYHSKYNPIERCWSALEQKWGGSLLNGLKVILREARRMTWQGQHPQVKRLEGDYGPGERWSRAGRKAVEARLQRSASLPKYDITIRPLQSGERQVK